MPSITVKNIPTETYEHLKRSAKLHRRSISSEIVVMIERAVYSQKINPQEFLVRARQLREMSGDYLLTDEEFREAKKAGRL